MKMFHNWVIVINGMVSPKYGYLRKQFAKKYAIAEYKTYLELKSNPIILIKSKKGKIELLSIKKNCSFYFKKVGV